jgi:hypothetical protein
MHILTCIHGREQCASCGRLLRPLCTSIARCTGCRPRHKCTSTYLGYLTLIQLLYTRQFSNSLQEERRKYSHASPESGAGIWVYRCSAKVLLSATPSSPCAKLPCTSRYLSSLFFAPHSAHAQQARRQSNKHHAFTASPICAFTIIKITKHLGKQMLSIRAPPVNSLPAGDSHTLVQRLDHGVEIRLVEERHRDALCLAAMHDAMQRALPQPVRPSLNHVADIYDKRAWDRVCREPSPVLELDVQGVGRGVREQ